MTNSVFAGYAMGEGLGAAVRSSIEDLADWAVELKGFSGNYRLFAVEPAAVPNLG